MEPSGTLVAHSLDQLPYLIDENGEAKRFLAVESDNQLVQATARFMFNYFGDLQAIETTHRLDFLLDGERQFVQVTPFRDAYGLDWLIVVVIPEADFMAQIQANNRQTSAFNYNCFDHRHFRRGDDGPMGNPTDFNPE